jgi:hypothetical protein
VTFIDDPSRWTKVYFLKFKNETFEHLKIFKVFIEVFTSKKLEIMGGGRYYNSNAFKTCCDNNGITHQMTTSYMPQQNGVAKWKN